MSKNTDQKHSKNYIQPKYTDSMTELGQQEAVKSTNFKSETKMNQLQKREFFFDDPDTFPETFKKKQSDNFLKEGIKKDKLEQTQTLKSNKKIKENSINIDTKKPKDVVQINKG